MLTRVKVLAVLKVIGVASVVVGVLWMVRVWLGEYAITLIPLLDKMGGI